MFNLPARIGTQHETALGKIPEGWEVRRLRTLVTMLVSNVDKHTKDSEASVRLCNYVDVYKRDVITAEQAFMVATASVDEIDSFRLHADDVVITKDSESFNDIGVPAYVASAADDLVYGYHLAILRRRSPQLSGQYLYWALRVPAIAHQLHVAAGGVTEPFRARW